MKRTLLPAAVVASGALWYASLGVHHVWPLAWLMPVPLLLALPAASAPLAALASFAAAAIGSLNLAVAYPGLPHGVVLGILAGVSLEFCLVLSAWRAIGRRAGPVAATLAYPVLLVTAEYLVSLVSPHGTAGSFAYSQMDVLPLIQIASITGPWGITFVLALVPSALAASWRLRREPRAVPAALVTGALPLLVVLGFGVVRLARGSSAPVLKAGLAARDALLPHFASASSEEALPVVREFAAMASRLALSGAAVVVLPEKFVGVGAAWRDSVQSILADVAREHGTTVVAGLNLLGRDTPARNLAVVFNAGSAVPIEYAKQHLVPGLERGYQPGTGIALFNTDAGLLGVAICKDLDFTPLGRAYSRAGVSALLVPAWDFGTDAWLHSRMAVLRGVEGGYAIVRTASDGLLTVSDPLGRVVAQAPSAAGPEALLQADVRLGTGRTVYGLSGDWLAWLCSVSVAVLLLRLALTRPAGSPMLSDPASE